MKSILGMLMLSSLALFAASGCVQKPPPLPPLSYVAVQKPAGVIRIEQGAVLNKMCPRGGWYFGNLNFRPAPDIRSYVQWVHGEAKSDILKNLDVRLEVPFVLDILFFGYNKGTDTVTCGTTD